MSFTPRFTKEGIYNNYKWYSDNPFYNAAYGLPNCTCYAWGRFWEVTGVKPIGLPTGNAGNWYNNLPSSFIKSQIPVLGAIACWDGGSYAGHVAIVEQILPNGDIVTSNSGYYRPIASYPPDTQSYFWTETCYKNSGYRSDWEISRGYTLQGFIVPSKYADDSLPSVTTKNWQSITTYQASYLNDKSINNAYCVADNLLSFGWSLNAVCAILGNMTIESFISPDLSEFGGGGYGLIQWTGARRTNLENYLDANFNGWQNDIDISGNGQCKYVDIEDSLYHVWIATNNYQLSYDEFKTSELDVSYLVSAYLYNMERPADPTASETQRQFYANYYFNKLKDYTPNGNTGKSAKIKKLPIWQYPLFRR